MTQPHICYLLKRFPRLSQTFVLNELLALRRRGLRVSVIALRRGDAGHAGYAELDAPVRYLDELAPGASDEPAAAAAALAPWLRAAGVSHIHAHFASRAAQTAARAAALIGAPFSFTAHAHDIFHAGVDRAALVELIARAAFVVTVSEYNRRYLGELLRAAGRGGRVLRLYNGVDLHRLQPGDRGAGPLVGVGRLIAKKGFGDLVAAAAYLRAAGRPVQIELVGEGEQRPALERAIAALGLAGQVRLLGALPPAATLQRIAGAAALAMPCVIDAEGDRDGLPTVLLEAMALGTPVIASDVAGIPELIGHGRSGLLVREGDPAGLAAAIACLEDFPALAERMRLAARARVAADFDLDRNAARLAELFRGARLQEVAWAA